MRQRQGDGQKIPALTHASRPTSQDGMETTHRPVKRSSDNQRVTYGIPTKHRAVARSSFDDQRIPSTSTSHDTITGNEY